MITEHNLTDAMISHLADAGSAAGRDDIVRGCYRARRGDIAARREVARFINAIVRKRVSV